MLKYITTIYQYQTYQHQIPHVDRALKELHLNEGSGLLNRRNSLYGKWIVFFVSPHMPFWCARLAWKDLCFRCFVPC